LSAIIAAVAVQKKIRKSPLANDVKARCLGAGACAGLMLEFIAVRIVSLIQKAFGNVSDTFGLTFKSPVANRRSVCSVFSRFYSHPQNPEIAMQTTIKTQSKTIASILAGSLVAFTLSAAPALAAEAGDPLTKTIVYGDLNLNTADGARVLYARIRSAAHVVCAPFDGRELSRQIRWQACYDQAMASAVAQIDKPQLTALHTDKTRTAHQG